MSEKNKWALPLGALERSCRHICDILALLALWRQMGVPTYLFRSFDGVDDFTQHIKK